VVQGMLIYLGIEEKWDRVIEIVFKNWVKLGMVKKSSGEFVWEIFLKRG
jgi:hypothetical protein